MPLHCEPINNVAVQLTAYKQWTLVEPKYWKQLQPTVSPNGRAYLASMSEAVNVPHYTVVTHAGDALWIPAWTWNRVDYASLAFSVSDGVADEITISGSLFHFRLHDFATTNPLLAFMLFPAMVRELFRYVKLY
jgi:hypothetical protein